MNRSLYTTLFKDYHGLLRERHYQLNFTTMIRIKSQGDYLGSQFTHDFNPQHDCEKHPKQTVTRRHPAA